MEPFYTERQIHQNWGNMRPLNNPHERANVSKHTETNFYCCLLSYEMGPALYLGLVASFLIILGCAVHCATACSGNHPKRFVNVPLRLPVESTKLSLVHYRWFWLDTILSLQQTARGSLYLWKGRRERTVQWKKRHLWTGKNIQKRLSLQDGFCCDRVAFRNHLSCPAQDAGCQKYWGQIDSCKTKGWFRCS